MLLKFSTLILGYLALLTSVDGLYIPSKVKVDHQTRRPSLSPLFSTTTIDNDVGTDVSALPLPPNNGMNIIRNIRDSFSYLSNPDRFIAKRTKELGPIFLSYAFFKPQVYCGGQENVKEFISGTELKKKVIYPSLPDTFVELHTEWGALNMDSTEEMFKEARVLFGDVLSSVEAVEQYSKAADKEIDAYVNELAERVKENPDQPIYLSPELKSLCLQIFSKIFSGKGLTSKQEQQFIDYNSALLSLSKNQEGYKKGKEALESLRLEMLDRFHELDGDISADTPGKWYHDQVYNRENFNDERISTGMVLFIWGAYVECASLCVNSLALCSKYGLEDKIDNIREEFNSRVETGMKSDNPKFWNNMSYTTGILRESLRLEPPGAGVPRFSNEDFQVGGYRIPAGTPIMLTPQIGNNDDALFVDSQKFEPKRWVPVKNESESSCPFSGTATKLGLGSWFPGGFGAHQCPGVPLAELVGRMFLTKMSSKFDSWEFSGEGLTKDGEIKYVLIPVKIAPDNFGIFLKLKE